MKTYSDWCAVNGCQHAHCPHGCEHPQPFLRDGVLYCGKHWVDDRELVRMVPCVPLICEGEAWNGPTA